MARGQHDDSVGRVPWPGAGVWIFLRSLAVVAKALGARKWRLWNTMREHRSSYNLRAVGWVQNPEDFLSALRPRNV